MVDGFDGATVTVLNWSKFNDRKDVKRSSWFRLEHDTVSSADFYDFTGDEFRAWIYILSQASKKNDSGKFRLSYAHADRACRIPPSAIDSAMEKLISLQCVAVDGTRTARTRTAPGTSMPATYGRTDVRDETNETQRTNEKLTGELPLTPSQGRTVATWKSYSEAYLKRYREAPVRNKTVNGLLAKFIERVPLAEAPAIAAFYLTHNNSYYTAAMHPVNLMLRDAEKLRTEWATGTRMLAAKAKEIERTQANLDTWDRAADIVDSRKEGRR